MQKLVGIILFLFPVFAIAGAQMYEPLSASVRAGMHITVSDWPVKRQQFVSLFTSEKKAMAWLTTMSKRLKKRMPDLKERNDFLMTVYYEARRHALDPQLILGIIQVESGFKKYALSSAYAYGYMQVMPFWIKLIGEPDDDLFHMRHNLRYGCRILQHYLKIEKGDYFRALGRYNGSLGKATYPNKVLSAWQGTWAYPS